MPTQGAWSPAAQPKSPRHRREVRTPPLSDTFLAHHLPAMAPTGRAACSRFRRGAEDKLGESTAPHGAERTKSRFTTRLSRRRGEVPVCPSTSCPEQGFIKAFPWCCAAPVHRTIGRHVINTSNDWLQGSPQARASD